MKNPKWLSKKEIEDIIQESLSDEQLENAKNHLLTPVFEQVFDSSVGNGTPFFKIRGDDREFLDCTSQAWVLALGHGAIEPTYAAYVQARKFTHHQFGFLDETRAKLAKKLTSIAPGKLKGGKVAFNNMGGSASNEAAIRLAYVSQKRNQKQQIVVFSRGYHGSSLAMTGATQYIRIATRYRPLGLDRWERAFFPYCYRCPWGYKGGLGGKKDKKCKLECLQLFQNFIEENTNSDVAAVMLEPIQGAGGQIPAPVEWLQGLQEICKVNKIQIIYDEFQTGFGRTGYMFATDYYNKIGELDVSPDMMTLAKAAGGGYPLGILLVSDKYKQFSEAEEHSTFSSTPVPMAACLVVLEIMQKHAIPENARKMGQLITQRLLELQQTYPQIGDVRGPGLFIGIEFVKDPKTREPFTDLSEAMKKEGWKQAIYFQGMMPIVKPSGEMVRNVLKIKPPLIINEEEANLICDRFELCLKNCLKELQ
ncbi:MAG: aspartate aminotransferase family protein [Candidatus Lokiarchaeota archaeon]|nr:aspartate aminotransferase family protein [Candidatus Lokiarchaeota archaeon]